MTTAYDIVHRAFRKLSVTDTGSPLEAEEATEGLDALNDMMAGWKIRGIAYSHIALAPADKFPLGPEFVEGVVYMLAGRLSSNYIAPPTFDADDWFRAIQAQFTEVPTAEMPRGLRRLPSRLNRGIWSS